MKLQTLESLEQSIGKS